MLTSCYDLFIEIKEACLVTEKGKVHKMGGGIHQYQCFGGPKFVALVVGCVVVLFVCLSVSLSVLQKY